MSSFERAAHALGVVTAGRATAAASAPAFEATSAVETPPSSHLVSARCASAVFSSACC